MKYHENSLMLKISFKALVKILVGDGISCWVKKEDPFVMQINTGQGGDLRDSGIFDLLSNDFLTFNIDINRKIIGALNSTKDKNACKV
jgi:hypothetical protein